jgi:high-affinity iron transporter
MLPTFVIGLREGLEAALIVGIVAAFLRKQGRADTVRLVWLGVAAAVALCLAFAVVLQVVSADLPQRQQEGLETVIGLVAVAMVTYMIIWMRRHARGMKGHLEASASSALVAGSAWALVAMAFLAVLREGFETSVFLLAAFQASGTPLAAGFGALLGILVACGLGYGIYRGGIRINLARFFTVTGAVLVLVAAGLLAMAFHTAHEAGWLNAGQAMAVDLSWLVRPGTVLAAVLTGVLGLQAQPTVIEAAVWLLYLVPMLLYVTWPSIQRVSRPAKARAGRPSEAREVSSRSSVG